MNTSCDTPASPANRDPTRPRNTSHKRNRIRRHYEPRVRSDRSNFDVLDWASRDAQEARFRVLAGILAENAGRAAASAAAPPRLLDVGCGLADLGAFLDAQGIPVRYVGVDLVHAVLTEARRRHPAYAVLQADVFAAAPFRTPSFDFVFCSGIFNLRLGNNEDFAARALPELLPLARVGLVANFLHARSRRQFPHCAYFDPELVAAPLRRQGVTLKVLDDYLENDFTVVARAPDRA